MHGPRALNRVSEMKSAIAPDCDEEDLARAFEGAWRSVPFIEDLLFEHVGFSSNSKANLAFFLRRKDPERGLGRWVDDSATGKDVVEIRYGLPKLQ